MTAFARPSTVFFDCVDPDSLAEFYRKAGKHAHLDLAVADLETATKELLALGANGPDFQPGAGDWVVLTDPDGHPLCLVTDS